MTQNAGTTVVTSIDVTDNFIDLPAKRFWHKWVGHRAYGHELHRDACPVKFTELTIAKIAAENGLVGTRLGWVLTLHGFLLASYALALNSTVGADRLAHFAKFQRVVAVVGSVTALIALLGIMAAYSAINTHKRRWMANRHRARRVAVQPFSGPFTSLFGRLPSTGFCLLLMSIWVYLLFWF